MSTCWAVGDRNETPLKPSLLLKEAEQPHHHQTRGAPAPDHLCGLCWSLPICPNFSCVWGSECSLCSLVKAKYRAITTCSHTNETWNFQPQNLMELFEFVCTMGASLIFQQWLRGSVSGYSDSGHLRIKHNTALTASGQELTPPHSLMAWIVFFFNALSIQTGRNLIQRQTSLPGGRELHQPCWETLASLLRTASCLHFPQK